MNQNDEAPKEFDSGDLLPEPEEATPVEEMPDKEPADAETGERDKAPAKPAGRGPNPAVTAAAAALVVIAVLAVIRFTTRTLESPETKLEREIDVLVDEAQRMLDAYEPAGDRFVAAITAATTESGRFAADEKSGQQAAYQAIREGVQKQGSDLDKLTLELEANQETIHQALALVQKAVAKRSESGERAVSGASHPAATRLEAILLHHKADLLRRRAAVYRAVADDGRIQVSRLLDSWRELDGQLAALASDGAADRAAAVEPSHVPVEPQAAGKSGQPRGALGHLARALFGGKRQPSSDNNEATPIIVEEKTGPAVTEAETSREPWWMIKEGARLPAQLTDQLAALKARRQQVEVEIEQARTEVADLGDRVKTLEDALKVAEETASKAQQRMLALEEAETDQSDPEALERFVADYRAASDACRAASREIAILKSGGIRNARPDTDNDDELLTAPLVPVDQNQEMSPQPGLVALRGRLDAARERQAALAKVLAVIDAQDKGLRSRRAGEGEAHSDLREARKDLRDRVEKTALAVIAAVEKANELETEAIEVVTGPGKTAADNANRAVNTRGGGPIVGHTKAVEADLEFLHARILAQRTVDLNRHQRTIEQLGEMEIDLDPRLLTDSAATAEAADDARTEAMKKGKAALDLYRQADQNLNRLWSLHANMAAVNHLLANQQTDPKPVLSLPLSSANALNNQEIPPKLQHELAGKEMLLSPQAFVSIEQDGSTWLIQDERQWYRVVREDDGLSVYEAYRERAIATYLKAIEDRPDHLAEPFRRVLDGLTQASR